MSDSRRNGSHSLYQQNQRIFKKASFYMAIHGFPENLSIATN